MEPQMKLLNDDRLVQRGRENPSPATLGIHVLPSDLENRSVTVVFIQAAQGKGAGLIPQMRGVSRPVNDFSIRADESVITAA
jgi:hypothetical protein